MALSTPIFGSLNINDLSGKGNNGDYAIDITTGNQYQKGSSVWTLTGSNYYKSVPTKEIGGGVDLNDLIDTQTVTQSHSVEAASGSNYPVTIAGALRVLKNDSSGGGMTWQIYHTYGNNTGATTNRLYVRTKYKSNWAGWEKIAYTSDLDSAINDVGNTYLPLTGGTITGSVIMTGQQLRAKLVNDSGYFSIYSYNGSVYGSGLMRMWYNPNNSIFTMQDFTTLRLAHCNDVTITGNVKLLKETGGTLSGGIISKTDYDATWTSGTYTPVISEGHFKAIFNGGDFEIAAPSLNSNQSGEINIIIKNGGAAGNITFSGFNKVTGDSLDTVLNNYFMINIKIINYGSIVSSVAHITALQ